HPSFIYASSSEQQEQRRRLPSGHWVTLPARRRTEYRKSAQTARPDAVARRHTKASSQVPTLSSAGHKQVSCPSVQAMRSGVKRWPSPAVARCRRRSARRPVQTETGQQTTAHSGISPAQSAFVRLCLDEAIASFTIETARDVPQLLSPQGWKE